MKLILSLLAVLTACSVSAVLVSDDFPQVTYDRYIEFIDEEGIKRTIDLEEKPDVGFLNELKNINSYYLFTRRNPKVSQKLINGDAASINSSYFNPAVSTAVVAHGWLQSQESGMNNAIRDAFLFQYDVNVIVLDWKPLATSGYATAVLGVPEVGRELGRFLHFLAGVTAISLKSVHLIGFSLGAHVVGNAGRELKGQVARISALDPAGPLWHFNLNRINASDALYVEGIHTDGGYGKALGIAFPIGDVDFFVNRGNKQPGCFGSNICSHNRSWRYFAATVTFNHLIGRHCASMLEVQLNICRGDRLKMGNTDFEKPGSGIYRTNTKSSYPY